LQVVNTQYFTGILTERETVRLERDPANIYDKTAIRVVNVMGTEVRVTLVGWQSRRQLSFLGADVSCVCRGSMNLSGGRDRQTDRGVLCAAHGQPDSAPSGRHRAKARG
jgi:hypothetical protein